MATIGTLAVKIVADSDSLSRGLDDASRQVTKFEDRVSSVVPTLAKFGAAAAAAGVAIGTNMLKDVAVVGDELAKLSQRTGVTVEDLSRLRYAADLSGVSSEALTGALNLLSRNMGEAAAGTGQAKDAFAAMGISIKNADGSLRAQDEVLADVADKFAGYEDGAAKAALAMQVFGRSGALLIPFLNAGSRGIREMGKEADALGVTMSGEVARASEKLLDNITRIQKAAVGAATNIAGPLITALADVSEKFAQATKEGNGFWASLGKVIDAGVNVSEELKINALVITATQNRLKSLTASYEANVKAMEAIKKGNRDGLFAKEIQEQIEKDAASIAAVNKQLEELQQRKAVLMMPQGFVGPPEEAAGKAPPPAVAPLDPVEREREMQNLLSRLREQELLDFEEKERQMLAFVYERLGQTAVLEEEETAKRNERLAEKIEAIRLGLLTESQLEVEHYARKLETLQLALEAQRLTEEEHFAMVEELTEQHEQRLSEIKEKELNKQQDQEERNQRVIDNMRQQAVRNAIGLLSMFAGKNKAAALAQIALNRGLMIGQTIQNTAAAQTRAFAENPYPIAVGLAANIGALGKANVALIAATGLAEAASVGSGSASMSSMSAPTASSGGVSTAPGAATSPVQQIANINVTGETFSRGQVVSLIQTINELSQDGVRLVIQ